MNRSEDGRHGAPLTVALGGKAYCMVRALAEDRGSGVEQAIGDLLRRGMADVRSRQEGAALAARASGDGPVTRPE